MTGLKRDKGQVSVFGLPTAAIITAHDARPTGMFIARAEPGTIDLSRLDGLGQLGCGPARPLARDPQKSSPRPRST